MFDRPYSTHLGLFYVETNITVNVMFVSQCKVIRLWRDYKFKFKFFISYRESD